MKNLPYRLTEDEMREVFENAQEIRIVMNKEGNSKGCVAVGYLMFLCIRSIIFEAFFFHILPCIHKL